MTLQAFALLCALATLSCVAVALRATQLAFVGAGVAAGLVLMMPALLGLPLAPLVSVEPAQVAVLLVLFALARLRGQVGTRATLLVGGLLAVVWLQALRATGWPVSMALPLVLLAVAIAAMAGSKKTFFPPPLRDEVALVLLVGALLVALVPEILSGWSSAQVMQATPADAADAAGVADVVWIAAGFVVCGAVFAWWKSKRRWSR